MMSGSMNTVPSKGGAAEPRDAQSAAAENKTMGPSLANETAPRRPGWRQCDIQHPQYGAPWRVGLLDAHVKGGSDQSLAGDLAHNHMRFGGGRRPRASPGFGPHG